MLGSVVGASTSYPFSPTHEKTGSEPKQFTQNYTLLDDNQNCKSDFSYAENHTFSTS